MATHMRKLKEMGKNLANDKLLEEIVENRPISVYAVGKLTKCLDW